MNYLWLTLDILYVTFGLYWIILAWGLVCRGYSYLVFALPVYCMLLHVYYDNNIIGFLCDPLYLMVPEPIRIWILGLAGAIIPIYWIYKYLKSLGKYIIKLATIEYRQSNVILIKKLDHTFIRHQTQKLTKFLKEFKFEAIVSIESYTAHATLFKFKNNHNQIQNLASFNHDLTKILDAPSVRAVSDSNNGHVELISVRIDSQLKAFFKSTIPYILPIGFDLVDFLQFINLKDTGPLLIANNARYLYWILNNYPKLSQINIIIINNINMELNQYKKHSRIVDRAESIVKSINYILSEYQYRQKYKTVMMFQPLILFIMDINLLINLNSKLILSFLAQVNLMISTNIFIIAFTDNPQPIKKVVQKLFVSRVLFKCTNPLDRAILIDKYAGVENLISDTHFIYCSANRNPVQLYINSDDSDPIG